LPSATTRHNCSIGIRKNGRGRGNLARVGSNDSVDLEPLEPLPIEEKPPPRQRRFRLRRPHVRPTLAFVIGLIVGSGLTIAVVAAVHENGSNPAPRVVTTTMRHPVELDSWSLDATDRERAANFDNDYAPDGSVYLIAHLNVGNIAHRSRFFDTRLINARYFEEGTWNEVASQTKDDLMIEPNRTRPVVLAFLVPLSALDFSLVFRRDLDAEKRARDAAEIQLFCCSP
jgi:hypothetical protein